MSFADLKTQRKNNFSRLNEELEKLGSNTQTKSYQDDRLWKPELDKSGNGYAVIRFLPACDGENLPWVRIFNHGFQGPGGWYIENSLTTLAKKDPMSEYNSQLWNSGIEANKELARKQKRRLNYTSNILILEDPKHPENEGKVFLYKYGKKIFDKINDLMNPEFEDENPVNPFDFWEGANFKLKIRKVEGFTNYDKSEFEQPAALFDGEDQKLEDLWKTQYPLNEFLLPENFKTYDELKARLDKVLQLVETNGLYDAISTNVEQDTTPVQTAPVQKEFEVETEDADAMSYFAKLAEDN
jgi:hypothetical protein